MPNDLSQRAESPSLLLVCGVTCDRINFIKQDKFYPCYAGRSDGIGAMHGKPCAYGFCVGQINVGIHVSQTDSQSQQPRVQVATGFSSNLPVEMRLEGYRSEHAGRKFP